MRYAIGWLLLIAAPITILAGYSSLPDAATCKFVNSLQSQLGGAPACQTHPAAGYFIGAGILAVAGLLCLAPLWGRWIVGKPAPGRTER
jgi:hypothetical protein